MIGKDISHAKELLEAGKLVGIPTETVYGLAGNGLNAAAVSSIFAAKNRPSFDPLILHTDSLIKVRSFVETLSPLAERLAQLFWPGPLTLILPRKPVVPDLVTSGLATVAVRIPNHPLTLSLLKKLSFPVAAPSANVFGYISPTTAEHVATGLGNAVAYVLDGGACKLGVESTIVLPEENRIVVLRKGGVPLEKLEELGVPLSVHEHSSSQPQAPGMLKQHYAPRTPIEVGNLPTLLKKYDGKNIGLLSFQKDYGISRQRILSPKGNIAQAAQQLFASLRALDALSVDIILAEWVPEQGLGCAINDRLRRAAAKS